MVFPQPGSARAGPMPAPRPRPGWPPHASPSLCCLNLAPKRRCSHQTWPGACSGARVRNRDYGPPCGATVIGRAASFSSPQRPSRPTRLSCRRHGASVASPPVRVRSPDRTRLPEPLGPDSPVGASRLPSRPSHVGRLGSSDRSRTPSMGRVPGRGACSDARPEPAATFAAGAHLRVAACGCRATSAAPGCLIEAQAWSLLQA